MSTLKGCTISELDICNLALGRIGKKPIASLCMSRLTINSSACLDVLYEAIDSVLRDHAWDFATKEVELVIKPVDRITCWNFMYSLPLDCVRALSISKLSQTGHQCDFEIVDRDDWLGAVVMCDIDGAHLKYTARVLDAGLWSTIFIDALAWRLAYEIGTALRVDRAVIKNAVDLYQIAINAADQGET